MTPALRFGIIRSGERLAAWELEAIDHVAKSGVADLVLVIEEDRCREALEKGSILWRAFEAVCRPRALRRKKTSDVFGTVKAVRADDLEAIAALDLDFLLDFTRSGAEGTVATVARYGAWRTSFSQGAGPPCFWETYEGEPTISARLDRVTSGPGVRTLLREGHLKTVNYLYARSVDQLCFEAAKWPAYVAGEIAAGLTSRVTAPARHEAPGRYRAPSNLAMLKFFWISLRNIVRRLFERRLTEEWNIGVLRMRPEEMVRGAPIRNVRWLSAIPGGWTADPMALPSGEKVHVLCEEMDVRSGKGQISATCFDGADWAPVQRVIATPTHASYPYLFTRDGEIYCVPETYEANEVALYRAREFPAKWERVATLMSGIAAIDTTLFEHDGRFWMFCTTSENSNAVLRAFYAPEMLGPWRPHASNPLKVDVRSARPAGAPFRVDGTLYRPAQDSSRTYGGRVVVHRVVTLTPTQFEEEPCRWIEPVRSERFGQGLHTISFAGEYCVIDGKRLVRRH